MENVRIFPSAAAAHEAGFRPCLRCRPEAAPLAPSWLSRSGLVSRAASLIADGFLDDFTVAALATRFGVSERHLRRLFIEHLGASPVALSHTRRLHLAKRLIDETTLPMTEIAECAGFPNVRRFNAAFRATYGRSPTSLRERRQAKRSGADDRTVRFTLSYRPPLDWNRMVRFLRVRALDGIESVSAATYSRLVAVDDECGRVHVGQVPGEPQLHVTVPLNLSKHLATIVERTRRLFDLDADMLEVERGLGRDPLIARHVVARPGLRVPGAWDPYELAVRAILGQRVSVRAARTLANRIVQAYGRVVSDREGRCSQRLFPEPEALADARLERLGLDAVRARAIRLISRAMARNRYFLEAYNSFDDLVDQLLAIPGIGLWTANYVAMRALGEPDAFPSADLVLRRAAGRDGAALTARELQNRAESWRPWRAYAAMHLWASVADEEG